MSRSGRVGTYHVACWATILTVAMKDDHYIHSDLKHNNTHVFAILKD